MITHQPEVSGGVQVQGVEEVQLFGAWSGDAFELSVGDPGVMAMDAGEKIEGGSGAFGMTPGFQAHAHDAIKDQGQEADQSVGADTVGQAVVDGRDLDVGFQHPEPALDVGEALVSCDCQRRSKNRPRGGAKAGHFLARLSPPGGRSPSGGLKRALRFSMGSGRRFGPDFARACSSRHSSRGC